MDDFKKLIASSKAKKIFISSILSLLFTFSYSQKLDFISLIYVEGENMYDSKIGFYQFKNNGIANPMIDFINPILKLSYRVVLFDDQCYRDFQRYNYWNYQSRCTHNIPHREDSVYVKQKMNQAFYPPLIVDTLPQCKKFMQIPTQRMRPADRKSPLYLSYVFTSVNDSILFLSFRKSEKETGKVHFQTSFIFNINNGKELTFYDCMTKSGKRKFLKYVFEKANRSNLSIQQSGIEPVSDSGPFIYSLTMFPELIIDAKTNEMVFSFGTHTCGNFENQANDDFTIPFNEIRSFLEPNSILFSIYSLLEI